VGKSWRAPKAGGSVFVGATKGARLSVSLFVDTSIWYAAADSSDNSNSQAKAVLSSGEALVTSDHVLIETWTLIRYRIGRKAAERFWQGLRVGVAIVETAGAADLETAWQIGVLWRDQDFSIVDRTSFAVMRRLGIDRAASLDQDFAIFRFGPNRRQAFVVIR
jgi:predicted nucleic acid-binding protein